MFQVTEAASDIIAAYISQHKWPHAVRIIIKTG